jgi:hypothetical protein
VSTTSNLLLALTATSSGIYAPVLTSSSAGQVIDLASLKPRFVVVGRREGSNPTSIAATSTDEDNSSRAVHSSERDGNLARAAWLEREFDSYFVLADDWDDQGAAAPAHRTLRVGRNLMRWAAASGFPCARTYLSPGGEVGLVWEKENGYADLSLAEDISVSYYIRDKSGQLELYSEDRVPLAEVPGDFWLLASTL